MSMIKPGHTSLNMDDVAEDLEIVHRHISKLAPYTKDDKGNTVPQREDGSINKPVLPAYQNKIVKADDVDLVAGIKAENTAICEGNRNTVHNSNNLEGHPASDFMLGEEGANVKEHVDEVVKNYGLDISDLRNEVYEMKHELEKRGLLRNTEQRMGYNDIFRNGYKPFEYQLIGEATMDCPDNKTIILTQDATEEIDDYDYIAVYFKDIKKFNIRQVKKVEADRETVRLDEALDSACKLKADNIEVYKSAGVSRDGNFYFAQDIEITPGDKEIYTGLDDDTSYKFRRPVKTEDSSYAYSFRIPEAKQGFLTEFNILARATGMPTLTCYIIDEQDMRYFKNPEQAQKIYESGETDANGDLKIHFFAKSSPVTLDSTKGQYMISFDFWDKDKESYPLIDRKDEINYRVRYVAIICGTYTDKNNYADIYFLQNKKPDGTFGDLELNNTVYYYVEQTDTSLNKAFATDDELNASDMFYAITLREKIENDLRPYDRGLYSAKMECAYPQGISRVRLMLRINREGGLWNAAIAEPAIYGGNTTNGNFECKYKPRGKELLTSTTVLGLSGSIRKPIELRASATDTWKRVDSIIGNNIVEGASSGIIAASNEPIMVRPDDMVYRNGFSISVKGKRMVYNSTLQKYTSVASKKIYLKPVAVIRDGIKYKDDVYSDRILFEGDFRDNNGNAEFFNELELQIYWEQNNFSESETVKKLQMGIIHDLVFSTDRAV